MLPLIWPHGFLSWFPPPTSQLAPSDPLSVPSLRLAHRALLSSKCAKTLLLPRYSTAKHLCWHLSLDPKRKPSSEISSDRTFLYVMSPRLWEVTATLAGELKPSALLAVLLGEVHIMYSLHVHLAKYSPTCTSSFNHLPHSSFLATSPRTLTLKESLVLLSGCFHIMKLTKRTRMAAIIHTAFIRTLGSRAVRIQLPTIRKPVKRHKSLLTLFLGTGKKAKKPKPQASKAESESSANKTAIHEKTNGKRYALPSLHLSQSVDFFSSHKLNL